MKTILIVGSLVIALVAVISLLYMRGAMGGDVQEAERVAGTEASFWSLQTRTLVGEEISLSGWKGQVALVVNVASKCGLTPQYTGLEKLHGIYAGCGFTILGFPSNDFLNQEPGNPDEIRAFCDAQYGITFPLFEKMSVKGEGQSEIYRFLTAGGLEEPTWNFTKYLVDREGRVLARFAPKTKPDDPDLITRIEAALVTRPVDDSGSPSSGR